MSDARAVFEKRIAILREEGRITLPMIKADVVTDVREILQIADITARFGVSVSVDANAYAVDGRVAHPYQGWFIVPADHGGMSPVSLTSNIMLIRFDRMNERVERWLFGCKHQIVTEQKGRCYSESHCERCDYEYVVDSGD
jgi:hypothetical protein